MPEDFRDIFFKNHNAIRGMVINLTVAIEMTLDRIITEHFCLPDKKGEFIKLLLPSDKITLENKRQVVNQILMDNYSDDYKNKYKAVIKDLELTIIPKRNEFAHGQMCLREFKDGCDVNELRAAYDVGFIRNKKGKEVTIWYTYQDIIVFADLVQNCNNVLCDFLKK